MPGHVAGLFLVLAALFIFDNSPAGVVHFIEIHGLSPRLYGFILALCGSFLLMAPRGQWAVLLITPITFYALMAWFYFLSRSGDDRILIAPLLYSALYVFMLIALVQDLNKQEATRWAAAK